MNYECSICKNQPNSHSFELIDYNDQTYFFYTCPAKAIKYYDCSGILQHYDGYLNQMTENTKWVWIFCLLYTSPSPRDREKSRMPSSA